MKLKRKDRELVIEALGHTRAWGAHWTTKERTRLTKIIMKLREENEK